MKQITRGNRRFTQDWPRAKSSQARAVAGLTAAHEDVTSLSHEIPRQQSPRKRAEHAHAVDK